MLTWIHAEMSAVIVKHTDDCAFIVKCSPAINIPLRTCVTLQNGCTSDLLTGPYTDAL